MNVIIGIHHIWPAIINCLYFAACLFNVFNFSMIQYKNVRPDYLKNIWKVINWKYADEIFAKEAPLVESR